MAVLVVRIVLLAFPIVGVGSLLVALFVCYAIAVTHGHVPAVFPFISNTGSTQPESCIFSQLFNIGAMCGILTFLLRYKMLQMYLDDSSIAGRHLARTNRAALVFGLLAAAGISLVGNFQSEGAMWTKVMHWIGASFAMGIGTVYIVLNAILSVFTFELRPSGRQPLQLLSSSALSAATTNGNYGHNSQPVQHPLQRLLEPDQRWIVVLRLCLCSLAIVALLVSFVGIVISNLKYVDDIDGDGFWSEPDGGYVEHVMAAGSQWTLFVLVLTSLLTLVVEFRQVRLGAPLLQFVPADVRFTVVTPPVAAVGDASLHHVSGLAPAPAAAAAPAPANHVQPLHAPTTTSL